MILLLTRSALGIFVYILLQKEEILEHNFWLLYYEFRFICPQLSPRIFRHSDGPAVRAKWPRSQSCIMMKKYYITSSKIEYLITKSLSLIPFNIIVRPSIKSMMQTLNLGIGLANIENL